MTSPEVTVVVICFNDADHLSNAVNSVLTQSLRRVEVIVVDDHSTDSTQEVAERLVNTDERVRYIRLPSNSGGCGAPRNAGILAASSPYVMFLDSDDTLERHACYNLWALAEKDQCDVVSGKCRRYYISTKTWDTWYAPLYSIQRTLTDIEQLPDLVYDSISTNKLYRTSYLIENGVFFPVGVKYEDLQFIAKVYATVDKFGIIPETVYHWRIYPPGIRTTITHERSAPTNLRDRLLAIGISRDIFLKRGKYGLADMVLRKTLRHDARITLNDVAALSDPDARSKILSVLEPSLRAIPWEFYAELAPMERATFAMAILRDVQGLREALMWSKLGGVQAGRIVSVEGTHTWAPLGSAVLPTAGSFEERLCRIDDVMLMAVPTRSLKLAHVVLDVYKDAGGTSLEVLTHDTFRRFTSAGHPEIFLEAVRSPQGKSASVQARIKSISSGEIRWTAKISDIIRGDSRIDALWRLAARITLGELTNTSPLSVETAATRSFADSNPAAIVLRTAIDLRPDSRGQAIIRRVPPGGHTKSAIDIVRKTRQVRALAMEVTRNRRAAARVKIYRTARRMPLRRNTILFDSHMGRQFSDNPRAIYEELKRRNLDLDLVWDFINPAAHVGVHDRSVRRHSVPYSEIVARASAIVDNQGLPGWTSKRDDQFHLQTWHGTPLKRMALHKLDNTYASPETIARITGEARWDALISPSEYFERTFVDAYRFKGELLRGGTPRNDVLINSPEPDPRFIAELDLPSDRKIALYAPTFREDLRHSRDAAKLLLDLDEWVSTFGTTHFLLIRSHYLNRFAIERRHLPYVMDVSHVEEISDLYRASDVLITDYSSVMFDYAWLNRPIVIYAPDYDKYVHDTRGTYFELRDDNPGLYCEVQEEIGTLVKRAEQRSEWQSALSAFRSKYSGEEDGRASARAADRLLQALNR